VDINGNLAENIYQCLAKKNYTAYFYKGQAISSITITEQSKKLAQLLMGSGVENRHRVLIFLDDTPDFITTFLAVMQIGAIPVPLNPMSKRQYIEHYLKDSGSNFIVCETRDYANISEISLGIHANVRILIRDTYQANRCDKSYLGSNNPSFNKVDCIKMSEVSSLKASEEFAKVSSGEAVYWQYTSGTTGQPKAVLHAVKGIIHSNECYAKQIINIGNDDCLYSTAKLFFGYGLGNSFFFPLMNNATAILDDRWPTIETIVENIKCYKPSVIFSVPALYSKLLTHGETILETVGKACRYVSAGSPLSGRTYNSWKWQFGIEILDGIGATEMGHIYLTNRPGCSRSGVTGKPVEGYQVKIVSEGLANRNKCQGMLYVKGPSVALGYHNNEAESEKKFKDGWYRTGDVFTRNKDGDYKYVGREDDLFKVKGRWVVPGKIEEFIVSNFPAVQEAVLSPATNDSGGVNPILYFVAHNDTKIQTDIDTKMHEYLRDVFESHYLPGQYCKLQALPRNDNGKIVRHLLGSQQAVS